MKIYWRNLRWRTEKTVQSVGGRLSNLVAVSAILSARQIVITRVASPSSHNGTPANSVLLDAE